SDDGDGFSKRDFDALMQGGIGNSTKGSNAKPLINNRPMLGRLGIGMLSIAQVCGSFSITSRPRKGDPFRARVKLYDLLKQKLDDEDPEVVRREETRIEEIDIGTFEFESLNGDDVPFGTSIVADDVHPAFAR